MGVPDGPCSGHLLTSKLHHPEAALRPYLASAPRYIQKNSKPRCRTPVVAPFRLPVATAPVPQPVRLHDPGQDFLGKFGLQGPLERLLGS